LPIADSNVDVRIRLTVARSGQPRRASSIASRALTI
jgi:hypothetical protein